MEPQELSARLQYLNNSAHHLATNAAETSRYLMSQCNSLMFDSEIEQTDKRRQEVCGACGNIMTVGWGTSVKVETQRRPRRSKRGEDKILERKREMAYTCAACSRTTWISIKPIELRKPTQIRMPTPATKQSATPSQAYVSSLPGPPTTGSSIKKRSKKKNGGLEALLANKKAADARNSGFALDLMDFMKKT